MGHPKKNLALKFQDIKLYYEGHMKSISSLNLITLFSRIILKKIDS